VAVISIHELVDLIKSSPKYAANYEKETDAKQALYISFSRNSSEKVDSEEHYAANGAVIVLDKTKDGVVQGIEIC
jgi:hypothetical protein